MSKTTFFFSGDQVAFFDSIDEVGDTTEFGGITAPFLPSDRIEVEVRNKDLKGNGEFKDRDVEIKSMTIIRGGERFEIEIDGEKIKAPGGKEQGDSFFTTNDEIEIDEPFVSDEFSGKLVFATQNTFAEGATTAISRHSDQDFNGDNDTNDSQETGNGVFNANSANTPPCFGSGTRLATPNGMRRVETLWPGDSVLLHNGRSAQVVLCAFRKVLLAGRDDPRRPVLIRKGAMGAGLPRRDLIVSPQHAFLVTPGDFWPGVALDAPRLIRAKALVGLPGIRRQHDVTTATYHTVMLDAHAALVAEGVAAESFWPGPLALMGLPRHMANEIRATFPGISEDVRAAYGEPLAPYMKVQETRRMLGIVRCNSRTAA